MTMMPHVILNKKWWWQQRQKSLKKKWQHHGNFPVTINDSAPWYVSRVSSGGIINGDI